MHSLRIASVFLLLILISFGTMTGCDEPDEGCGCLFCDPDTGSCTFPPFFGKDCNVDEYVCAGECTPVDIDCCVDHFGDEVGSCPKENPFCCEEYDL